MSDIEEVNSHRAEIAARSRRRALEDRERKLSTLVCGLMAYSAFANLVSGLLIFIRSPLDGVIGIVLGALYAFGLYRAWMKDDTHWWPVAVPAGISIALGLLSWIGGVAHPVPILVNVALLVLVPMRRRAAEAVPRKSLKVEEAVVANQP